ncbi:Hypothetical predicted protein [Cloeon dipterum]|uniref:Uncharacterized protein n=1 Tax=Cloeon dipterum TaxID=197152 RepID=A0A8S1DG60_9INSE|nr:Hypothetical predicted protein [Cloeon dipterum]
MADDGNMSERINCELHNMLNSVKSIIGYCEDTMKKKLQTSKHHQAKCEAKSRRGWIFHADPSSSSTSSSARIEEAQKLHRSEEETPIDIKNHMYDLKYAFLIIFRIFRIRIELNTWPKI